MRIFMLALLLGVAHTSWAQSDAPTTQPRRNGAYLELGGKSPYYALNYERTVWQRPRCAYNVSLGVGLTGDELSVPLSLAAVTGAHQHHAEFSLGLSPALQHYRHPDTDKVLYVVPGIGYRYQQPTGGISFGVGFTPLIFIDPPSYDPWDFSTRLYPSARLLLGWRW